MFDAWKQRQRQRLKNRPERTVFYNIFATMMLVLAVELLMAVASILAVNVTGQLDENAKDLLTMRVRNRASYVQEILRNAEDLEQLSEQITATTQQLLKSGDISLDTLDNSSEQSDALLVALAPQLLDTLREKQVHAVFFLTGDYAKKETDLVNRMIAEGHVLGNHGMTHASLPTLSEAEAKAEIMDLHQYVLDKYGYEMQYFRCPCGEYSEAALETAQACGYRTLFWSDAYVDWKTDAQPDPAESLERLRAHAHGGEILLLHAVSSTNAEILGDLIDALRAEGYTL